MPNLLGVHLVVDVHLDSGLELSFPSWSVRLVWAQVIVPKLINVSRSRAWAW